MGIDGRMVTAPFSLLLAGVAGAVTPKALCQSGRSKVATPVSIDPHDADNEYTWSGSGAFANGTLFTSGLFNVNGLAGQWDWRVPTLAEPLTIAALAFPSCSSSPCIDPIFGPTAANPHWSDTMTTANQARAWFVHFFDAVASDGPKSVAVHFHAVRGGL